jgi:hypothetical protein
MKPSDCPSDEEIRALLTAALPHCNCEKTINQIASVLTTNEVLPSPTGYPAQPEPNQITYWAYALLYWRWESKDLGARAQVRFPFTSLAMFLSQLPQNHENP